MADRQYRLCLETEAVHLLLALLCKKRSRGSTEGLRPGKDCHLLHFCHRQ